ncbi:MAG: enoyl-CoA hydratase/isomerase family protein [Acidimicrobiia bacterium]
MDQPTYEYLDVDVQDGACWITLRREKPHNAFCTDMYLEIKTAIRRADWDDSIDCMVITGTGAVFGVGGDLHEVLQAMREFREGGTHLHRFQDNLPFEAVRCARKPVISAVNGTAVGAGMTLAVVADISIAAASARLGIPETRAGALDAYLPYYLFGQVSMPKLKYLLYTGKSVSAQEAERIGLITEVVEDDRLHDRVREVIAELRVGSLAPNMEFKRILGGLVPFSTAAHTQGATRTWELLMSEDTEKRLKRFERPDDQAVKVAEQSA